jgi:hypothetical protein
MQYHPEVTAEHTTTGVETASTSEVILCEVKALLPEEYYSKTVPGQRYEITA